MVLRAAALYLLVAISTRAADALGVGGGRLSCGCEESCWCRRPGLTVFRWATPRRLHHIELTPEEERSLSGGLEPFPAPPTTLNRKVRIAW